MKKDNDLIRKGPACSKTQATNHLEVFRASIASLRPLQEEPFFIEQNNNNYRAIHFILLSCTVLYGI
jgi:hypothetical protein